MRVPERLQPLVDDGMVDEVLYQLMSGKEAQVYVVRCGDPVRCAKVFKEARKRSFKQAVEYQEGRKVRNSRRYFGKFAPELLMTDYGKEIWALYESGDLHPESRLTGCFEHDTQSADVDELMAVIDAAKEEESERQERLRDDDDDNQL